eukprot:UN03714
MGVCTVAATAPPPIAMMKMSKLEFSKLLYLFGREARANLVHIHIVYANRFS